MDFELPCIHVFNNNYGVCSVSIDDQVLTIVHVLSLLQSDLWWLLQSPMSH